MTAASRIAVATSALRKAEQGAVSNKPTDNKSGGSLYTGSGRSKDSEKKGGFKNKLKKRIALAILLGGIGGGAIFMGVSNSLLAPALQILVTEATDTQYTSGSMRAVRILKYALKGEGDSWDGGKAYSEVPENFETRLKNNNIDIDGETLVYTNANPDGTTTVKNIDADNLVDAYRTDTDFRDSYSTAKRGRVAYFFDQLSYKFFKLIGVYRNDYNSYKQTGDADADMAEWRKTLSGRFDGDSTSITRTTIENKPQYDEQGNAIIDQDTGEVVKKPGTSVDQSNGKVSTDAANATTSARSIIESMSSTVSGAVNLGCGALAIGSAVATLIAVNEIYQSIDYFLNNSENLSKMMAGFGSESAVNSFLNFITAPATAYVDNFGDGGVTAVGGSVDDGSLELGFTGDKVELDGAFTEGNAAQMVLANAPGSSRTTDYFSFERVGNSIANVLGTITAGAATYRNCAIAKIGVSALSIAVTISPAGLVALTSNLVFKCLKGVIIAITASVLIGFLVETLANTLTNPVEYLVGEAASAEYFRGATASNGMQAQVASSQSPLGEAEAAAYNRLNQEVLALDAEVDRKNHNPFDITNHNTFLGNIAYRFVLPLMTSSSILTNTSNFLRTTSTSIASIISPNTYAASGSSYSYPSYVSSKEKCSRLADIGVVGGLFCEPKRGSDPSTIDTNPDDHEYWSVIEPNLKDCDDEGNCTIIPGSELDDYQQDCDGRTSPFGVMDQNILNRHLPTSIINNFSTRLGTILSGLPLIGEIMDGIDGISTVLDEKTLMWGNGQICSNTPENPYWGTMKYYQRYIEDMRLIDQMHGDEGSKNKNEGEDEEEDGEEENEEKSAFINPVVANFERYTSENPITSYADYLSRISGLTIDTVETILALVDYSYYIGLYDPDTRVALDEHELTSTTSTELIANLEHEDFRFKDSSLVKDSLEHTLAAKEYIIYADLRSRNYVA